MATKLFLFSKMLQILGHGLNFVMFLPWQILKNNYIFATDLKG